jgi:hypothetical protein
MSAEFAPSFSGQQQQSSHVEYGDMPQDPQVIADLIGEYTERLNELKNAPRIVISEYIKSILASLITTIILILTMLILDILIVYVISIFLPKNIMYKSILTMTNIVMTSWITILLFFHTLSDILKTIKETHDVYKIAYVLKNITPLNSLVSAMLQSEKTLTKSEQLLLDLRNSEADEAIIEAREILKRANFKDIP